MTIGESLKNAISNAFKDTIFRERTASHISQTFATKVSGSDNVTILPFIPNITIEKVDDTHDKVNLCFSDMVVEGVITWKPSSVRSGNFVFIKIE